MYCRRIFLLLLLIAVGTVSAAAAPLTIDFVDVGQGDAVVIVTADDTVLLLDGGTEPAGRDQLIPHLERLGINRIDIVIATHPHADHIGGLIPVLERFPVGQVYADGQLHTTRTYERFLEAILTRGIPFYLARAGNLLTVPGIDRVEFLHPTDDFLEGLNDNSVVVRLEHAGVQVLFTGDLETAGEQALLNRGANAAADVLKVGHHGSRTSTTEPFLAAVDPSYAIISAGAGNRYGHPHDEVVQRLERTGANVYRTDKHGTIRLLIAADHWQLEPLQAVADQAAGQASGIRIRHASVEELQSIPGIGPVLAERMVQYRREHTITSWEDLLDIQGIGPATLERIREHAVL